MKKILAILFVLQLFVFAAFAQDKNKPVKDTVIKGQTYQLYIGSKGGRYINVVSKKSGKTYRKYFKNQTYGTKVL